MTLLFFKLAHDTVIESGKLNVFQYPGGGVLPNKEVRGGGLGPHVKFGGKIWGKVRPSSPNKRKNLGSSVTTRCKSWEKSPNFGVISEIQRAKFGVFVTCIFGGKIWGSNKNFRGKFWGQARRPPNMEVPPGFQYELLLRILPTNRLLRLMKIRQSDLCSFCDKETETISHLFRECESALRFWNSLSLLVLETNVLRIDFKQRNILLGILKGLLSVNYFIL